uniref:DUF4138 domain-containing protein n=1 Tax=Phocaeicola vulgatus TaxID=821 RepID=UPI00402583F2
RWANLAWPKGSKLSGFSSKSRNRLILGFDKFTIPDDKVFEIEIYERNGGRHIKLAVLNEYILSAEPLYKPQP